MSDLELSPYGRARRDQILKMALQQASRRRRRRLAFRAATGVVVLLAIGLTALRMPRLITRPKETPIAVSAPRDAAVPDRSSLAKVVIERIQTDPTITRRLAIPQTPPRWEILDDDHFLEELAQAGKPAGLVKINGQVTLVFHQAR